MLPLNPPKGLDRLRQSMEPVLRRGFHTYWRFARGMTLGVRGVVINERREVLLVEHSYVRGWHLPGGGVEVGETVRNALARELVEEADVEILDPPDLHGLFFNFKVSRRDHVAVYVISGFRLLGHPLRGHEIRRRGFFPLDTLPEETTGGTRRRLDEVFHGAPVSEHW